MHMLVIKCAAYEDEAKYMFEAEDKRTSAKLVLQGWIHIVPVFLNNFIVVKTLAWLLILHCSVRYPTGVCETD